MQYNNRIYKQLGISCWGQGRASTTPPKRGLEKGSDVGLEHLLIDAHLVGPRQHDDPLCYTEYSKDDRRWNAIKQSEGFEIAFLHF